MGQSSALLRESYIPYITWVNEQDTFWVHEMLTRFGVTRSQEYVSNPIRNKIDTLLTALRKEEYIQRSNKKGSHIQYILVKKIPLPLHPAITHINASPEFLANPKNIAMINKMVEATKASGVIDRINKIK